MRKEINIRKIQFHLLKGQFTPVHVFMCSKLGIILNVHFQSRRNQKEESLLLSQGTVILQSEENCILKF